MQRGDFLGKRLGRITYVCEKEGHFEIPGVTFFWFDFGTKELKKRCRTIQSNSLKPLNPLH